MRYSLATADVEFDGVVELEGVIEFVGAGDLGGISWDVDTMSSAS